MADTFANRLRKALAMNNMTQSELSNKTGLDKSLISNYLSGNYKAKQSNLSVLAETLGVSEPWLMGFDVTIEGKDNNSDQLAVLFSKHRDILTKEDEEYIRFIIEKRKREIDKQQGVDYDNWYVRGKHNPTRIAKRI